MDCNLKAEGANSFDLSNGIIERVSFSNIRVSQPLSLVRRQQTLTIEGHILSGAAEGEVTKLAKWALVPASSGVSRQNITCSAEAAGHTVREHVFENGFVLSYTERLSSESNVGSFTAVIRDVPKEAIGMSRNNQPQVAARTAATRRRRRRVEAVFSTVNSSGQRTEIFRYDKTFTDDTRQWTVVDESGITRTFRHMLNQGYRFERQELMTRTTRLPIRNLIDDGDRMHYVTHSAMVIIEGARTVAEGTIIYFPAYIDGGMSYIINPIAFFESLGINSRSIRNETDRYVISTDSRRIVFMKPTVSGLVLDNVHTREVYNRLGQLLDFDFEWNQQRRAASYTFSRTPSATPPGTEMKGPPAPTPTPPVTGTGVFTPRLITTPIAGSAREVGVPRGGRQLDPKMQRLIKNKHPM